MDYFSVIMSRQLGKKIVQWIATRTMCTTEELVKNLTVPLKEHEEPLKVLKPDEKRNAVLLRMKEVGISPTGRCELCCFSSD